MGKYYAISPLDPALNSHPDGRIILAIRGPGFGAEAEPTPAADATAWILVALLIFCLSWILCTALFIKSRLRKQRPPNDFKPDVEIHPEPLVRRSAWEKPADWWKGEDPD